jgi:hypothetical protein
MQVFLPEDSTNLTTSSGLPISLGISLDVRWKYNQKSHNRKVVASIACKAHPDTAGFACCTICASVNELENYPRTSSLSQYLSHVFQLIRTHRDLPHTANVTALSQSSLCIETHHSLAIIFLYSCLASISVIS